MKNLNILFLGGAKRVSVAETFIEVGKDIGFDVNIFSYELSEDVPISKVAKIIIGKKWNDNAIYDDLLKNIEVLSINIVIPFLDPSTLVVAKLKNVCQSYKNNVFFPVSSLDECELFFDKLKSEKWCLNCNINYPKSEGNFPMFAKPINGSASKGIRKINTEEELLSISNREDYVVQKYIDGEEYSIDIYRSFIDNEIKGLVPRMRLETQGGESIKTITIKDQEIIDFANDLILKTNLKGPLTLQVLKEKGSNQLYFMELNPRFGGAVVASIAAGVNIPKMIIYDYCKKNILPISDWSDKLLMIRYFNEIYRLCK